MHHRGHRVPPSKVAANSYGREPGTMSASGHSLAYARVIEVALSKPYQYFLPHLDFDSHSSATCLLLLHADTKARHIGDVCRPTFIFSCRLIALRQNKRCLAQLDGEVSLLRDHAIPVILMAMSGVATTTAFPGSV